ncbi:MAG TPA: OmpA family protein [Acetobacteraceae bacterium]|nr:OmpA family protein [Acetobacteraceae bacterium]
MKRALLTATLLGLSGAAVPRLAQAQPVSGLYIGGGGGFNYLQDEAITAYSALGTKTALNGVNTSFNGGVVGLGSIGWGFGNGFRVEVEGNYRHNRISPGTLPSYVVSDGGSEDKYGTMVNVLFDMDIGLPWLYPYVGGGAGYSWVHQTEKTSFADGTESTFGGTQGSFAYQVILGLSFPIAPVVGLSATVEYRFFGLAGNRDFTGSVAGPGGTFSQTRYTTNDYNHSALVGLRYAFNVPPPPPPPAPAPVAAPAPAPSRTYLVFFDWDRADLTPRAREIIAEAAQNSTRVQYTRIVVNGYTDTSGTPAYNLRLSMRRADAVKAELIRDGVPANVIDTHGYGETHLLVPTGPGVREPQNRRVEIILK